MEVKELLEKGLADVKSQVEQVTKTNGESIEAINAKMEEVTAQLKAAQESGVSADYVQKMQEQIDAIDAKMQKKGFEKTEYKSFNDNLADLISEKAAELSAFANSTEKEMRLQLKAVGDMSYTSNFSSNSASLLTTEVRQNPLLLADNSINLRDLLPKGTTNAAAITYPRYVGGEGAPAPWESGTKPQMDFDFDAVTDPVQWIAGYVRVPRQMLDDVQFLESFLRANMLKSLYKAENAQILNGTGVAPQLKGLMPQAQAYNGEYTKLIEQIIDAAYGQVTDNGHSANAVVLNARDAIGILLNKATGSGEYDVPGGVGFVNGRMTIGGLNVVQMPTPQLASGTFLTGDFNAAQLITRLNPEIRLFEQDGNNVRENMITIRIEERVALPVYYPNAFVKKVTV